MLDNIEPAQTARTGRGNLVPRGTAARWVSGRRPGNKVANGVAAPSQSIERFTMDLPDVDGVYLVVKTCEVFLCFVTIMLVLSFVLASLPLLCFLCSTSLVKDEPVDDFDQDDNALIASEETSKNIEEHYLRNPNNYTLFSGGATGSDMYWQNLGTKFGVRVKAFSFEGHGIRNNATVVLSKEKLKQADEYLHKANRTLKRHFPTEKSFVNNLLRRNWYQVKDTNGVFAVGQLSASRTTVEGGTGWAVQMAIDAKKPVYVFDILSSSWKRFDYKKKKFMCCKTVPRLSLNFTAIGTRTLPEDGKAAIKKIFEGTFGKLSRPKR